MLRNYFATAIRNLLQHRLHSAINIGGLALGLAACLLILLFVRDELSYDRWLPNADRIASSRSPSGAGASRWPSLRRGPAKAPLRRLHLRHRARRAPVRRAAYAGRRPPVRRDITYVARFSGLRPPGGDGERAACGRSDRLLVSGAWRRVLRSSPLGRTITIDNKLDFTVVGVLRDLPSNTHLDIEMIALFDTKRWVDSPSVAEEWTSANVHTYVMFRSPEAIARVESELPAFTDRNVSLKLPGFEKGQVPSYGLQLHARADIHLYPPGRRYVKPVATSPRDQRFSAIAADPAHRVHQLRQPRHGSLDERARDVSMRKVLGATRGTRFVPHMGEAALTAVIALVLAIASSSWRCAVHAFLNKELSADSPPAIPS